MDTIPAKMSLLKNGWKFTSDQLLPALQQRPWASIVSHSLTLYIIVMQEYVWSVRPGFPSALTAIFIIIA